MSHTAPVLTLRRRREGQGVNGTPAVASEMTHLQLDPPTVLALTAAAHTYTHTQLFTLNSSFAASHKHKRKHTYINKDTKLQRTNMLRQVNKRKQKRASVSFKASRLIRNHQTKQGQLKKKNQKKDLNTLLVTESCASEWNQRRRCN